MVFVFAFTASAKITFCIGFSIYLTLISLEKLMTTSLTAVFTESQRPCPPAHGDHGYAQKSTVLL